MPIQTKLKTLAPSTERLKTTITLISKGYSVRSALPEGELVVYPWDSEISEWLVNRASKTKDDMTLSADVVAKLTRLPGSVVDNFVASELLLVMLVARSLTTDGVIKYTAKCPHCGTTQKEATIAVPAQLGVTGEKSLEYPGYDEITLPSCGDLLRVRPLLVADIRRAREGGNTPETACILSLGTNSRHALLSITSVNGGTPDSLLELVTYYKALPPTDVGFLKARMRELSPALDTMVPQKCENPECEKEFKYDISMGYDFFL